MMKISEIFLSLQGEGRNTGRPVVFIRFYGCAVCCSYCDSKYTWSDNKDEYLDMSAEDIVKAVKDIDPKCCSICITGGDPDLLPDNEILPLIDLLKEYEISIEASGFRSPLRYFDEVSPRREDGHPVVDFVVMDVKGPSAHAKVSNPQYISELRFCDQAKFLVSDEQDFDFMIRVLEKYDSVCEILISPVMTANDEHVNKQRMNWLAEKILSMPEMFRNRARLNFQLHKIIWGNERGR
jgi:7-carboxy-7-deazaguanine synthase